MTFKYLLSEISDVWLLPHSSSIFVSFFPFCRLSFVCSIWIYFKLQLLCVIVESASSFVLLSLGRGWKRFPYLNRLHSVKNRLDTRKTCLPSNDGAQLNTLAIKLGFLVMKFVIYAYRRQKYCYGHGLS